MSRECCKRLNHNPGQKWMATHKCCGYTGSIQRCMWGGFRVWEPQMYGLLMIIIVWNAFENKNATLDFIAPFSQLNRGVFPRSWWKIVIHNSGNPVDKIPWDRHAIFVIISNF